LIDAPERASAGWQSAPVSLTSTALIYLPFDPHPVTVFWCDRNGVRDKSIGRLEHFTVAPEIAPSGSRVITRRPQGGETWLVGVDLESGATQQLTRSEEWNSWPIWATTADRVFYAFSRTLGNDFEIRSLDPDDPQSVRSVVVDSVRIMPVAVTHADKGLLFVRSTSEINDDIYITELGAAGSPRPYAATTANESDAALLPDGKSAVFVSDATGRPEIYLDDFPDRRHATQLTRDGCSQPWSLRHFVWAVGSELIYCARDGRTIRSMRLERAGGRWVKREDRPLFVLPFGCFGLCPSADGSRFLVIAADGAPSPLSLTLVQNWRSELPR
jgi:TolB protein